MSGSLITWKGVELPLGHCPCSGGGCFLPWLKRIDAFDGLYSQPVSRWGKWSPRMAKFNRILNKRKKSSFRGRQILEKKPVPFLNLVTAILFLLFLKPQLLELCHYSTTQLRIKKKYQEWEVVPTAMFGEAGTTWTTKHQQKVPKSPHIQMLSWCIPSCTFWMFKFKLWNEKFWGAGGAKDTSTEEKQKVGVFPTRKHWRTMWVCHSHPPKKISLGEKKVKKSGRSDLALRAVLWACSASKWKSSFDLIDGKTFWEPSKGTSQSAMPQLNKSGMIPACPVFPLPAAPWMGSEAAPPSRCQLSLPLHKGFVQELSPSRARLPCMPTINQPKVFPRRPFQAEKTLARHSSWITRISKISP